MGGGGWAGRKEFSFPSGTCRSWAGFVGWMIISGGGGGGEGSGSSISPRMLFQSKTPETQLLSKPLALVLMVVGYTAK